MSRLDNFPIRTGMAGIICMGGRTVGASVAWDLVQTFLASGFSDAGQYLRRLGNVSSLEAKEIGLRAS